jgi:hypothetical protein
MGRVLNYLEQIITDLLNILGLSSAVPQNSNESGREMIINPRTSKSTNQVIVPARYKITDKDAVSVVRRHEYINARPPRSVSGGER